MSEFDDQGEFCDLDHFDGQVTPDEPEPTSTRLADHTTMHVGGPATTFVTARTEAELLRTVRDADHRGEPVLILGGGSNLVIPDEGFDGTVVHVATRGVHANVSGCGGAYVTVAAGECWDRFVELAVRQDWGGIECLSGIPGQVGSTPIQNVGAYGAEVAQVIARVRTWDRRDDTQRTFFVGQCDFGYRSSRFKAELGRYLVLDVDFHMRLASLSVPLRYADLAAYLGVEQGAQVPNVDVRAAVIAVRATKGMVVDPADHDTWSCGSFFTNPILDEAAAAALPAGAPRFPVAGGGVKTSAAWLIDHAGFHKGYPGAGPVTLSTKHTLAVTNRGAATAADVLALAREVIAGVEATYGVTLVPEPTILGGI